MDDDKHGSPRRRCSRETIPNQLGPYTLHDVLGRGGIGVVVRASHRDGGSPVALKTTRALDPRAVASLRREAFALERLRHPGVVRLLDRDTSDERPWYTMVLHPSETLRDHLARKRGEFDETEFAGAPAFIVADGPGHTTTYPAPPSTIAITTSNTPRIDDTWTDARPCPQIADVDLALGIGLGLAETLAYVHGEGFLHLDLKPDNVLVTEPRTPILFDFGLTRWTVGQLGREDLEQWTTDGGTVHYMAPEQCANEAVDARTDLYALGCLLYELLTGRPPFAGPSPRQIVRQHRETTPDRPAQLAIGVPRELDALVMALLAKSPRDRPSYASDIAARLRQLGARSPFGTQLPRPRSYLYRSNYVGSRVALDDVCRRIDDLEAAAGGVVLLAGDSGVGKTRTLAEASSYGRRRQAVVITDDTRRSSAGRGDPDARTPLQLFASTMRAAVLRSRHGDEPDLDRALRTCARVLAPYEPTLRDISGFDTLLPVPPLPFAQARLRVFEAIAQLLTGLAGERGAIIVLDDVQWADQLSLLALGYLSKRLADDAVPALVVAAFRRDQSFAALDQLTTDPHTYTLRLDPLGVRAVGELLAGMLGLEAVPMGLAQVIEDRTGGNPYLVAEYLRMAIDEGMVSRDADGAWRLEIGLGSVSAADVATELDTVVTRRIGALAPAARLALQAAAVLGRDADPSTWQATVAGHIAPRELAELADELAFRQLLQTTRSGASRFPHQRVRQAAYASLDDDTRRDLHAAAATAIEHEGDDSSAALLEQAQHWESAAIDHRARPCYLEAARRHLAAHALDDAEHCLAGYLHVTFEPDEELVGVYDQLAVEIAAVRGDWSHAATLHRAARALSDAMGYAQGQADALRGLASVYNRMPGRADAAEHAAREAMEIYQRLGLTSALAKTRTVLAYNLWIAGDLRETERLIRANITYYANTLEQRPLAESLDHLALMVELPQCRFDEAAASSTRANLIARQCGELRLEAISEIAQARVAWKRGALNVALPHAERAIALAERIADARLNASFRAWRARIHLDAGRLAAAEVDIDAIDDVVTTLADPLVASDLCIIGEVELARHNLDRAYAAFTRALELQCEHCDTRFRWPALWGLATIARRRGDLERARDRLAAATDIARFVNDQAGVSYCACEHVQLGHVDGQPVQSWIDTARSTLPGDVLPDSRWAVAVDAISDEAKQHAG